LAFLTAMIGYVLADDRLPNGMRVSGAYVVWRGSEYVPGGDDPKTGRTVISFYGPEPFEDGFKRKRTYPRHRWPTWSRWVPLDEIERRFKVKTVGAWRDAEFRVIGQSDDEDVPVGDRDVLVEGPMREFGERKPIGWWLELPNMELLDQGIAFGWVPWSELTDLREEIRETPFPPVGS
jgi:hypothetical protein